VFALSIPQLGEPVRLRGKVLWTTPHEKATQESPPGMGIRFQYADVEEQRATERIVEDLMRAQLGEHISSKLLGKK
jgi:type IV pilus assembly protein PilZ